MLRHCIKSDYLMLGTYTCIEQNLYLSQETDCSAILLFCQTINQLFLSVLYQ